MKPPVYEDNRIFISVNKIMKYLYNPCKYSWFPSENHVKLSLISRFISVLLTMYLLSLECHHLSEVQCTTTDYIQSTKESYIGVWGERNLSIISLLSLCVHASAHIIVSLNCGGIVSEKY